MDERVSTLYFSFKEVKSKKFGPKWVNLYGPPFQIDEASKAYAELITLSGENASTYRGRLLMGLETYDC